MVPRGGTGNKIIDSGASAHPPPRTPKKKKKKMDIYNIQSQM
jgi:hypothetical protein